MIRRLKTLVTGGRLVYEETDCNDVICDLVTRRCLEQVMLCIV